MFEKRAVQWILKKIFSKKTLNEFENLRKKTVQWLFRKNIFQIIVERMWKCTKEDRTMNCLKGLFFPKNRWTNLKIFERRPYNEYKQKLFQKGECFASPLPCIDQGSDSSLECHRNFYKKIQFFIFFAPPAVGSPLVKRHLKVYRGANPLACASALCHLTPEKSKK